MCWLLSFAAGIMVSVVCFGLVPESAEIAGTNVVVAGLALGAIVMMVLNRVVDRFTSGNGGSWDVHLTHEELFHEGEIIKNRGKMRRAGIFMLIAIGLHNIPEGMAIGAGGTLDFQLGIVLAVIIALHSIPEGMAVAAPLLGGGIGKMQTIFLTALSGFPMLIGGILGVLIGGISDIAIAASLTAAGGAMLYIVFGEIIPQSVVMTKSRIAPVVTLLGIIAGLVVTQI